MTKGAQIRVRIEAGELGPISKKAHAQGIPLSELVRRLLRAWARGEIATPANGGHVTQNESD